MEHKYISLKSKDLRQFNPIRDLNPKFYRIQKVVGTISSTGGSSTAHFRADRLMPNSLLYGYAYVDWAFDVQRQRVDNGAPDIFPAGNEDVIYAKPFGMMNATRNVTMSFNGFSVSYRNMHIWSKYVQEFASTEAQMYKKFSTDGGPFPTYNGSYNDQALPDVAPDVGIQQAINVAFNNYRQSVVDGISTATFSNVEPLMLGLFNPYESKHDLLRRSWYKNNAWVIPHVNKFEMTVEFTRLCRNTLIYMYALAPAQTVIRLLDQGLSKANLYLTWISQDAGFQIPRKVILQSWNVQPFQFPVNSGVEVDRDEQVSFASRLITLHQVPSSVLIFATNTQQDTNCLSIVSDTDGAGANQSLSVLDNGMDHNMAMDNVVIRSNINNQTVTAEFSRQQLYKLTEKNCREIPYDFSSWVGGSRQDSITPGNTFLYLYPDDLNIFPTPGLQQNNFTFDFSADLTAQPGFSFSSGDFGVALQFVYNVHIVFFFDNFYITRCSDGNVEANYLARAL